MTYMYIWIASYLYSGFICCLKESWRPAVSRSVWSWSYNKTWLSRPVMRRDECGQTRVTTREDTRGGGDLARPHHSCAHVMDSWAWPLQFVGSMDDDDQSLFWPNCCWASNLKLLTLFNSDNVAALCMTSQKCSCPSCCFISNLKIFATIQNLSSLINFHQIIEEGDICPLLYSN